MLRNSGSRAKDIWRLIGGRSAQTVVGVNEHDWPPCHGIFAFLQFFRVFGVFRG